MFKIKLKQIVLLLLATMSSDSNITFDGKDIDAVVYTQECYVTLTMSSCHQVSKGGFIAFALIDHLWRFGVVFI